MKIFYIKIYFKLYKTIIHSIIRKGNKSDIFNLGNGNGYSVKEVIDITRKVTNFDICALEELRRSGDSAV